MAQMVKNLRAVQETWVWSLGWEDPLEKGMVSHSYIFAWKIPRKEEPGGLQTRGLQRVRHDWHTDILTWEVHVHTQDVDNLNTLTQGHTVRPIESFQVDPKIGALNIFWLNILHPFKTLSRMNLDINVQIWKGYQTYMCILEAVEEEERK